MNAQPDDITRTHVILAEGTMVHHYRIVSKVGAGGMGEVYLADDTKLGRPVALKFLPVHLADDTDVRARFTREAQAAAKLDHPNIVTVYEVGEFGGRPFFSMQYIDGKTLQQYCHEASLPLEKIVRMVSQISDGLAKAHAAGVTHRDIKAANIIVDKDLRPKILDFGLAAVQGGESLTRAGSTLGTVAYMSPEQAQGRDIDSRSDLFSLGIVLYELIAGQSPFKRNNDAATLHAIIADPPEPLARYKAETPAELQRIIFKALAKNPDERYQSAADLTADLCVVERSLASGERMSTGRVAVARPSIAVLPFTNMSRDEDNEFFADGLTEELLNVLAKNPGLRVTGRTSSFAFKGKQEDLRTIGQRLGVGTLLEGSVRKAGNRVRITAQLVNVTDGFHLWSETYDRVLDDIFAVQDNIAKAVSMALHVALVGVTEEKKAANPESYALVLRAHHSFLQFNAESMALAVELYKKALSLDPENARAWAGLSIVHGMRIGYGHGEHIEEYPKAKEAATRALALNDQLPEAHQAMAFVLSVLESRLRDGLPHIRRAYELAPNDSAIVSAMSVWEMVFGNFDRAISLGKKSIELDPLNPSAFREFGRILLFAGHVDEAREMAHRALKMSPEITTVHLGLGVAALFQGDFGEALRLMEKEKVAGYRYCGLAIASFAAGNKADSDKYLEMLRAEGEQWAFQCAMVHGFRLESDEAFQWLERAYELHDAGMALTGVQPMLRNLHTDPRWPVFLKKIGLGD